MRRWMMIALLTFVATVGYAKKKLNVNVVSGDVSVVCQEGKMAKQVIGLAKEKK